MADTASIGSVMIPQMVKAGYPRVFATNVTICGSVQALLIPPSHNAVIYSLAAGGTVSVAHLFLAGIFPGLLFAACLIGLVLWTARRKDLPVGEPIALRQVPKLVADAMWGLVTVVIIMGGILSGVFTPTESAAVACVYAFLVTMFIYRDYRWRELPHLVHRVVKTVAMVMMLIGFSVAFGYMMAIMQIPAKVTQVFLGISENKYVFLLLVNLLLLVLGTFMDVAPMLLICTPIFMPVILKLGIDPVHFGMIMILNLGIGLITPPVGSDAVRRLCDRQGDDGAGVEGALAVLRRDVPGAAAGDLHPGDLALAAGPDALVRTPTPIRARRPATSRRRSGASRPYSQAPGGAAGSSISGCRPRASVRSSSRAMSASNSGRGRRRPELASSPSSRAVPSQHQSRSTCTSVRSRERIVLAQSRRRRGTATAGSRAARARRRAARGARPRIRRRRTRRRSA